MPGRNLEKTYLTDSYYHIYNRGVNKRKIFLTDQDFSVFLNLLKRYLGAKPTLDYRGREYAWLYPEIELLAFCLMPNHFHLFIYQHNVDSMTKLLRGVCTAYTLYFNKKYKRVGPLFQDRFRAALITDDAYLEHITRYIHLNPVAYKRWEFSSYQYYLGSKTADWVRFQRVMELFRDPKDYEKFVDDYAEHKKMLDEVKSQLAEI